MLKIKVKLFAVFVLLSASLAFVAIFAHADTTKRIKFAKGKTSAIVKGAVLRDEVDTYIVGVNKGQWMTVDVTSIENNASFRIRNASGEYVQGADELSEATIWKGTVTESGDYKIEVAPNRGNATYSLKVSVVGSAAGSVQNGASVCAVNAVVGDSEIPRDIYIHKAPNSTSETLGEIPALAEVDEFPTVEIIGYSKGWMKTQKALTFKNEVIFAGIGWIPAKRIALYVRRVDGNTDKDVTIFALPKKSGKTIGTIPTAPDFNYVSDVVGFDCFGLKVTHKDKTGWISKENICGNSVTTCH